jgi:hypothetical protein
MFGVRQCLKWVDAVEKVENGGAPKMPVCNRVDAFTEPELPDDFVVDIRARGDWD